MTEGGFIKIDRNMLRWRWVSTPNTAYIFILLLLKANYKDVEFKGMTIHRGQLVTSIQSLANQCSLTTNQVRTALDHLISTGEITSKAYSKFRVITIPKYNEYQDNPSKNPVKTQSEPSQNPGKPQQVKNNKNIKKERNIPPKSPKGGLDPSGVPERGTDAFRVKSHLLLKPDEGTVDDIPTAYRDGTYGEFTDFAKYWRSRNR